MFNPVDYAINHSRLTLATLLFLLVAGFSAYLSIPKEAEPDVSIPIIYVNVTQRGISPEDAERLILRPLETQLKSVESVKKCAPLPSRAAVMCCWSSTPGSMRRGSRGRSLEVDDARGELPREADEPNVSEVNLSLFPCWSWRWAATCPNARCCKWRARRRPPSSRSPESYPPTCAARATRRWRSSPSRCS
jgi:multidrug efflux pump